MQEYLMNGAELQVALAHPDVLVKEEIKNGDVITDGMVSSPFYAYYVKTPNRNGKMTLPKFFRDPRSSDASLRSGDQDPTDPEKKISKTVIAVHVVGIAAVLGVGWYFYARYKHKQL